MAIVEPAADLNSEKAIISSRQEFIQAIHAERPDLARFRPEFNNQGQMALTAVVGKEVFKAVGHLDQVELFDREIKSLRHMQGRTSTPIPLVTHTGQKAHFFGMLKISGEQITPSIVRGLSSKQKDQMAYDVAALMLDIRRSFSPAEANAPVLSKNPFHVTPTRFNDNLNDPILQNALGPDLLKRARQTERIFRSLDLSDGYYATHGDIKEENILFSRATGRLAGIVDFGLVGLRQPEIDLSKLGNMPRSFLNNVSRYYERGGAKSINVDAAIALHVASKISELAVQLKHDDLTAFREPSLNSLRAALENFNVPSRRVGRTRSKTFGASI